LRHKAAVDRRRCGEPSTGSDKYHSEYANEAQRVSTRDHDIEREDGGGATVRRMRAHTRPHLRHAPGDIKTRVVIIRAPCRAYIGCAQTD